MDLRSEVEDEDLIEALKTDWRKADLAAQDRALLEFAEKLTRRPAEMGEADVVRLRESGFEDPAIHDAVQVISYFNYINRVAEALGTDPEPEFRSP